MAEFRIDIPDAHLPWELNLEFVGQPMGTNYFVFAMICEILKTCEVESIIELGTYHGALSLYLGMWAQRLGIPCVTFDVVNLHKEVEGLFDLLGIHYLEMDVFTDEAREVVLDVAHGEPTYLICDGGDKVRELDTYLPLIPVGSVVSVHDWGTEIESVQHEDVPVEQLYRERWQAHDARFATIRKIGHAKKRT